MTRARTAATTAAWMAAGAAITFLIGPRIAEAWSRWQERHADDYHPTYRPPRALP